MLLQIAQGLGEIIKTIGSASAAVSGASPFTADESKSVLAAATTFVRVNQALLRVIIGKHGLITLLPFFEPIRWNIMSVATVFMCCRPDLTGFEYDYGVCGR